MTARQNINKYRAAFKALSGGTARRDGTDYAMSGTTADGRQISARISGNTGHPLAYNIDGDRNADLHAALGL